MSRQQDNHNRETKGFTLRPDVCAYIEEVSDKHEISQSQVAEDILVGFMNDDEDFTEVQLNVLRERRENIDSEIDALKEQRDD